MQKITEVKREQIVKDEHRRKTAQGFVNNFEAEIDSFIGCEDNEEDWHLRRLLYCTNKEGAVDYINGKHRTRLAKHIYDQSYKFLERNFDYGLGESIEDTVQDIVNEIAITVSHALLDYKYCRKDITVKHYYYFKEVVSNTLTDLRRKHLADKRETDRLTEVKNDEELARDIYTASLTGRYVSNIKQITVEDAVNSVLVEQLLADKSLTDKERKLMQVKLDYPLATLTELAELAGYADKSSVSKAFNRIANKLQDYKPAIF